MMRNLLLVTSCASALQIPRLLTTTTAGDKLLPLSPIEKSSPLVALAATIDNSIDIVTAATSAKVNSNNMDFDTFDYMSHWYPVVWAEDALPMKPTKVTLFDVDYVVAKLDDDSVICMEDRCPHKSAALSEGRITASGKFQCAYHGWSFNGDGSCVEIPQVASLEDRDDVMASFSSRTSGTARPCQISQGMIWIYPGGGWEEASAALPPPRIPEYDMPGFRVGAAAIRDFPIDFSVLLENIMDPDHGIFVHATAVFDRYSASKDVPQSVEEEILNDGKGWKITSRVDDVEKLLSIDKTRRGKEKKVKSSAGGTKENMLVATSVFSAPNLVTLGRHDKETGETTFTNAFLICPTGVGRSRFMSCLVLKAPFFAPRWLVHSLFNNFLDQDTHLLATQQKHVLQWEANATKEHQQQHLLKGDDNDVPSLNSKVRKRNYVYQSPTEKMGARLGSFFDATLSKIPGRTEKLLELSSSGQLLKSPEREFTLDRRLQHLAICPGSQRAVRNCERIITSAKVLSLAVAAVKLLVMTSSSSSSGSSEQTAAILLNRLLSPSRMGLIWGISVFAGWLANKVRREFFFKYTTDLRDSDLKTIPQKVWSDKV